MHLSDDRFCHGADVLPRLDDVIQAVANAKPSALLLEAFGEYLRLTEENPSFSQKVKSLLELECHSTKRVWIPVLCAKSIFFSIVGQLNHRYENAMYEIDLPSSENSNFVLNVYPPSIQSVEDENTTHGIKNWLKQWEELTIASGNTLVTRQTALFTPATGNYTVRVISDPEDAGMVQAENCQAVSQNACPAPMPPPPKVRRIPVPEEPLAFCAKCGQWTPMRWLPKEERSRAAETWFECEYCGCRELKLRYVVRAI